MGKSTINGPFSIAMLVYQRVRNMSTNKTRLNIFVNYRRYAKKWKSTNTNREK